VAQERNDLEFSRLYLNVAIECFNKAALEEHADGAEVFRRMGRHRARIWYHRPASSTR
jgi:hypothetical protein